MTERLPECTCGKCGKPVPFENDATLYDSIVNDEPLTVLLAQARHLLPTQDCEGSPSRAQYIPGQPRDRRGYPYIEERAVLYREVYAAIQEVTQGGKVPLTDASLRAVERGYKQRRQASQNQDLS